MENSAAGEHAGVHDRRRFGIIPRRPALPARTLRSMASATGRALRQLHPRRAHAIASGSVPGNGLPAAWSFSVCSSRRRIFTIAASLGSRCSRVRSAIGAHGFLDARNPACRSPSCRYRTRRSPATRGRSGSRCPCCATARSVPGMFSVWMPRYSLERASSCSRQRPRRDGSRRCRASCSRRRSAPRHGRRAGDRAR